MVGQYQPLQTRLPSNGSWIVVLIILLIILILIVIYWYHNRCCIMHNSIVASSLARQNNPHVVKFKPGSSLTDQLTCELHNGEWIPGQGYTPGRCQCPEGYSGTLCQIKN